MKQWLITGASSGFGRLLAEGAATNGDHVFAVTRREDRLRELAAGSSSSDGTTLAAVLDGLAHLPF